MQVVGAVGWGGATLDIPGSVDPGLAAIISACWGEPEARPSFGQLITSIRVSLRLLLLGLPISLTVQCTEYSVESMIDFFVRSVWSIRAACVTCTAVCVMTVQLSAVLRQC